MKMNIDDLDFEVMVGDFNHGGFRKLNLFNITRVKYSVALYLTRREKDEYLKNKTPDAVLCYLFGDTWGRVEYEFLVQPMLGKSEDEWEKTCVYEFFVVPNKDLLLEMVESVSVTSARKWLRGYRASFKKGAK